MELVVGSEEKTKKFKQKKGGAMRTLLKLAVVLLVGYFVGNVLTDVIYNRPIDWPGATFKSVLATAMMFGAGAILLRASRPRWQWASEVEKKEFYYLAGRRDRLNWGKKVSCRDSFEDLNRSLKAPDKKMFPVYEEGWNTAPEKHEHEFVPGPDKTEFK